MLLRWLVVVCLLHAAVLIESQTSKKHQQQKADPCMELSCEHECTISNGLARCTCRSGYVLSKNKKSCEDVDECSVWPPKCSQMCQNIDGGYVCSCDTEYYTLLNNTTCKAKGERPKLIYTSTNEIVVKILNSSMSATRIDVDSATSVSYSQFGHYVYWVDKLGRTGRVLKRGIYDVYGTPEVVASVSGDVNGIAVDWVTPNLYLAKDKQLLVCGSSAHSNCKTMWSSSEMIGDVVTEPAEKKVFWIEERKHIMACSLACGVDGSSPHFIASGNMRRPRGLVIDRPTRTVYWTDFEKRTIERSSIDGHNKDRKVILQLDVAPIAVAVFEDLVYWTNGRAIHAANKFTGQRQADPVTDTRSQQSHYFPINILITHSSIQTREKDPCVFAECSQLSLPSPTKGCVCACDDQSEAMENGKTCRMTRKDPHLLLTTGDRIYQMDFNNMNSPKLVASMGHEGMLDLLAYDPVSDVIIVYKSSTKTIYGVRPNKESDKYVIFSGSSVGGLAVDEENGNVYWTVSADGRVMATTTINPKEPITTAHMFGNPTTIAIASKERLVFVADMSCSCIYRMALDGSGVTKLISQVSPVSMTVTTQGYPLMLIWSDFESESVRSIQFDGTNAKSVMPFIEVGSDLVLHGETLYLLPNNATYVTYANNYGLGMFQSFFIGRYLANGGVIHHMTLMNPPSSSSSPCLTQSNECEYFCISARSGTKCLCPNGLSLSENGKCTRSTCQYGTFKCDDQCLLNWKRCNGEKDCADGSDETGCIEKPKQCRSYQFKCKNKECIALQWRCDGHEDCADGSDEQGCPDCPKTNWKCKTQPKCILRKWLCDGREDCSDGSDESPEQCKDFACNKDQFKCSHGGCIDETEKCDGFPDCVDGSDENEDHCLPECEDLKVRCHDGSCIAGMFQCDGKMDCPDGEDERPPVCLTDKTQNCTCPPHTHFTCKNSSICLPSIKRCNGVPDCPSGTDEKECPTFCPIALDTRKCLELCDKFNFPFCQRSRVTSGTASLCDQHSWQCLRSRTCVPLIKTCDGKPDCPHGEDEGERCASVCFNKGGCDYECHPTPFGPRCSCHAGYILAKDKKSCIDYDECNSVEGYCSQMCINKSGGIPLCKCGEGYKLESDRRTCKAMGERGKLLFALGNSIRMLNLANNNLEPLIMSDKKISGMGYDSETFTLYWAEVSCNITTVKKIRIYDGLNETVTAMEGDSTSMSYDWVNSNLYISRKLDLDYVITICSTKSLQCSDIIEASVGKEISSVTVDPVNRKLFWIESTSQRSYHMTMIRSSRLDGAEDRTLKDYVPYAKSLAIDHVLSKVYWSDGVLQAILSMDFNGNKTRVILTARNELSHPHALTVFEDQIYFSNMDTLDPYEPSPSCIENSNITMCNKFTGDRCKNMHRHHSGAHSIAITNKVLQPRVRTMCEQSKCKGICIPLQDRPACMKGRINQINGPCNVTQIEPQMETTVTIKELVPTSKPQLEVNDSGPDHGGLAAGITIPILLLLLVGAGFFYMRSQKNSEYLQSPNGIPFKGLDAVLTEEDELQKQHDEMEARNSNDHSNPTSYFNKSFSWTFHKGRSRLEEE